MKVPFNDLNRHHEVLIDDIQRVVTETLIRCDFIRGSAIQDFEIEFSKSMGLGETIACANGTDAILIALKALDIGVGDEVLVPAQTWISTGAMVSMAGAKPVFVDIEPTFSVIDPQKIEQHITPNTKAIIPVHLYGNPCDMDAIMQIANNHKLKVIEDCAQAHGTMYKNRPVGTFGEIATFSFYPGKNLGALGDAGAVCSADHDLALRLRRLANHGGLFKGEHLYPGLNSRMDTIQAKVLSLKLPLLKSYISKRQKIALTYINQIKNQKISVPKICHFGEQSWHLFVLQTNFRDNLQAYLADNGIECVVNYKTALPFLPAFSNGTYPSRSYPVAFEQQNRVLSIPNFPEMTELELSYVIDKVNSF